MSLLDVLRGRPSPNDARRLVEAASSQVSGDPAGARATLEKLGLRPWHISGDGPQSVELGFALRAYASWRLVEVGHYGPDLTSLAESATSADAVLPIVPILTDILAELPTGTAQQLVSRFGGCANDGCRHGIALEAALGVVSAASDAQAIARWCQAVDGHQDGVSVRLAGYRRLADLDSEDHAGELLDGDDARLRAARATLLYRQRRYEDVIATVPEGTMPAQRAALAAVLDGRSVDSGVIQLARRYASEHPAAEAMLAESSGMHRDAARAWKAAGRSTEAQEALAIADPATSGDPAGHLPATAWYAHAAARQPRPTQEPVSVGDAANARIGRLRTVVADLLEGRPPSVQFLDDERLLAVQDIIDGVRRRPASATAFLAAAEAGEATSAQLASMATAVGSSRRTARVAPEWGAWKSGHGAVPPVPRSVDPLRWLADGSACATPSVATLDELPPDARLAVLAALVDVGSKEARAVGALLVGTAEAAELARGTLPELAALAYSIATRREAGPDERRLGAQIASAALAHRVARRTVDGPMVRLAVEMVSTAVADLTPDPRSLTPTEVFKIETEALATYGARVISRAQGPVLCLLSGAEPPVEPPDDLILLYSSNGLAAMLLKVGRAEEARHAYLQSSDDDTLLEAEIAIAIADRHLAGKRPFEALHELAALSDPSDLVLVEGDILERVAVAVVRARSSDGIQQAAEDADVLLEHFDYMSAMRTMGVELRTRCAREREGSAANDIPDLERAVDIDPEHPGAIRQLANALVVRAMESVERDPVEAVRDVDRATDLFMGDPELSRVASRVATVAAVRLMKQRSRPQAIHALQVAVAIDPDNDDALAGLAMLKSQR